MARGYFVPFTDDDLKFIRDNYLKVPTKRIADKLGCKSPRVHKYANSVGLKLTKARIAKFRRDSFFKKGDEPMNKGKKQEEFMTAEAIAKTAKTRFKKGHVPHNAKHDGKPYFEAVNKGWVILPKGEHVRRSYTTWLCEQRGIDMTGMVARYRVPMSTTVPPKFDDLEVITRIENMRRNTIHRYPQEMKDAMRLIGKLRRTIKKRENGKK